jgi:hypothetical protein
MNINLFMGLNTKKAGPLSNADSQIFKSAKNNELVYDKFKEIMSSIKKHESAENYESIKPPIGDPDITQTNGCASVNDAVEKSKVNESMKSEGHESKSLSIKRLKNIDKKLSELVSFIILANSSGEQKLDNLTIRINDGQLIAADGNKEIIIDSSFFDCLSANITASLDQYLNNVAVYLEDGAAAETVQPGSLAKSGEEISSITLNDVLIEAMFDALNKTLGENGIQGGTPGKTGLVLGQEHAGTTDLDAAGTGESGFVEIPGLGNGLEGIKQPGQSSGQPITDKVSLTEANENSDEGKDGRFISLKQALNRLFKQLDIPLDLIDLKIDSIVGGIKPESEEFKLGKKDFLSLAKKITLELSQLSKNLTVNLEELIPKLETGLTGKFELNSHLAKSLRNSEAFESYAEKLLKPFVFQAVQEGGVINSGGVNSNPAIEKTSVNLADVIMQISSRIINKDGPVIRQLEIMLKPESLGAIRIKVEAAGDGVSIKIQTQYSHTEEIISSNLDMLKNNLSEKGVLLKDLSVFMDLNTGTSGKSFEGFSGFGEALKQGGNPKLYTEADSFEKDSNEAAITENSGADALSDEYNNAYGVDIVA